MEELTKEKALKIATDNLILEGNRKEKLTP